MDLGSSKYDIGQTVVAVKTTTKQVYKKCLICEGRGDIKHVAGTGKELAFQCPQCSGRGTTYEEDHVEITHGLYFVGTIKGIEVNIPSRWGWGRKDRKPREVMYFIDIVEKLDEWKDDKTNIYNEDNLFLTKEEALAECERRRREVKSE